MIYLPFRHLLGTSLPETTHDYDRGGERQVVLIQVNNVGSRILLLFTPGREGSGETPA